MCIEAGISTVLGGASCGVGTERTNRQTLEEKALDAARFEHKGWATIPGNESKPICDVLFGDGFIGKPGPFKY